MFRARVPCVVPRRTSSIHRGLPLALLLATLIACGNPPSAAPAPLAGARVGDRCERHECGEGLVCRYEGRPGAFERRCGLDVGRCRDSLDCSPSVQRCMRLGERLGVCQDSGI
jgi:hypothetical protein